MDTSKFKDIMDKLGFLKSYSSLFIPAVIALLGIILFVPTQLMSSKLKETITQKSISGGARRVKSLSNEPVPQDQWLVEKEYQQAYSEDANLIAFLTRQVSCRELLSYKIFPEPKEASTLIFEEFRWGILESIGDLIVRVNARECPTETELQRHTQGLSLESRYTSGRRRTARTTSKVDETIIDVLCQSKARSATVYSNPADIAGYNFWHGYEYSGRDESLRDCWYWQLAYWIVEDVFDTVYKVNKASDNVFASKVKRLLYVNFERQQKSLSFSRGRSDKSALPPAYVFRIQDALVESSTGKICDDATDIVHFNISVIVSTDGILPFMKELCSFKSHKFSGFYGKQPEQVLKHNQITILETRVSSIDRQNPEHQLYRYGQDAVVRLDLICEYIFNKEGYDEVKPQLIKDESTQAKEGKSSSRQRGRRSRRRR